MISGPPSNPDTAAGTETTNNAASYTWNSLRGYSFIENHTGGIILAKIEGTASTSNWDFQIVDGERLAFDIVLGNLTLYFLGASPVRTGSPNANFTVKGWPYPQAGAL